MAALQAAAQGIMEAPRTTHLTKDHARYILAQLRRSQGRTEDQARLLAQLGLARSGFMLGPFDNSAGSGHAEAFGPEIAGGPNDTMLGRGARVAWRDFNGLAPHGVIELSHLLTPASEACAYVAVCVRVPRNTRAALRLGATDAVKAWVNEDLVLDHDTRRFPALDQEGLGISLRRGLNLIVVKVSWSQDLGQLMLRVNAPQGGPLKDLEFVATPQALAETWPRSGLGDVLRNPKRVRTIFDELMLKKDAQSLALNADLIAVLGLYDQREVPHQPEQLLAQAVALAPSAPNLRFMLGHRTRRRDPSRALAQFKAALIADPGYAPAQLGLAELARDAGRLIDARRALDAAVIADPSLSAAHIARASLGFEMLDEGGLALNRLHRAWSAHSELRPTLGIRLARMQKSLANGHASEAHTSALLKALPNHSEARSLAIRLAIDSEKFVVAQQLLAADIKDRPHILGLRLRQARLLAAQAQGVQPALQLLRRASRDFARAPEVWALRAQLELFENNKESAQRALTRAQTLAPHDPDYRRHLRRLAPDSHDVQAKGFVDAVAVTKAPVSVPEQRHGAIYLTDRKIIRRLSNGKSTRIQQYIQRLHNPRLEEALKTQRIYYSPSRETVEILAAERIRPNGEVTPASQILDEGPSGKVSGMYVDQRYTVILFDNLEAGDAVHIKYRVDAIGPDVLGGFFGDVAAVQSYLPKEDFVYEVIAPADQPIYQGTLRVAPASPSTENGQTALAWHLAQVPALQSEPLGPPYAQVAQMISVSSYENWDALGKWYGPLFSEQMSLDDAARAAGRAAIASVTDPAQKVQRLYNYVVNNTRYVGIELGIHGWKPFKASEVHRRRYGDCKDKATLLSALLRDNGIEATLTLVRTADRGPIPKNHASMWAFNHAITYVPELDLFLDPTAEFNGSTELPTADQGAVALVVYPDGRTQLVQLPVSASTDNTNRSTYEATIDLSSQLKLRGRETFTGAPAADLRRTLQEPEQRIRRLEEPLSQIFPGVKVRQADFSDLANLEAQVSYTYDIEVPSYGRRDADSLSIPVALFQHQVTASYAQLPARMNAVHITHAWQTQNIVRYHLPTRSKLRTLPQGRTIDSPYISLNQEVRRTKDGFETDDTVTLKQRVVPAAEYPEFRKACLEIDRALARKVVIQW